MNEGYLKMMMRWVLMSSVLVTATLGYGQVTESKGKAESPAAQPQTAQVQSSGETEAGQDERSFQLTFVVRELDESGKVVNSRRYDTVVMASSKSGGGMGSIRTGTKLPVAVGSGNGTYLDVGANFDVNRSRIVKGTRLVMYVSAEISSIDPTATTEGRPMIRQNRWAGSVEIPIGGHKVIFSSDDLSSKRTMQIELTVTPVLER
jgi:hypothetical protein